MLQRADKKSAGTALRWVEADALSLPFPDGELSIWLLPPLASAILPTTTRDCARSSGY